MPPPPKKTKKKTTNTIKRSKCWCQGKLGYEKCNNIKKLMLYPSE